MRECCAPLCFKSLKAWLSLALQLVSGCHASMFQTCWCWLCWLSSGWVTTMPYHVLALLMIPLLGSSLVIPIPGLLACVCCFAFLSILLMASIFHFLVCKCSPHVLPHVHSSCNVTLLSDKAGYVTPHHSNCTAFILWSFLFFSMAHETCFSSSSTVVLAIIIWSLVFHFTNFRLF